MRCKPKGVFLQEKQARVCNQIQWYSLLSTRNRKEPTDLPVNRAWFGLFSRRHLRKHQGGLGFDRCFPADYTASAIRVCYRHVLFFNKDTSFLTKTHRFVTKHILSLKRHSLFS